MEPVRILLLAGMIAGSAHLTGCDTTPLDGGFAHRVIDAKPSAGEECCTDVLMVGDLDGDGQQDIVVGGQMAAAEGLVWYRGPSWERRPIAAGEFTTDGKLADMDGDGDLDIVVGTFHEGKGETLWFENRLSEGVQAWPRHVVGPGYAHDIVVADVDADRRPDVLVADKKGLTIWRSGPGGTFERWRVIDRAGEGIAAADLDGDGDVDIVYGGAWLENPSKAGDTWPLHAFAPGAPADTRVVVTDMNGDGRADVVMSASEGRGKLEWFEAPGDPRKVPWPVHPIAEGDLEGAHSLLVADMDLDGRPDVVTAEMHTSRGKRVLVFRNTGTGFEPRLVSRAGSHNLQGADLDGDGDIDLVGKNYAGRGRAVEFWENLARGPAWGYRAVDEQRPKSQQGTTGLVIADIDGDRRMEIVAGGYAYARDAGSANAWTRFEIDDKSDIHGVVDADGDARADLVGFQGDEVIWFEAPANTGGPWTRRVVGRAGPGRTQGFVVTPLNPASQPVVLFTRGRALWALEVPGRESTGAWRVHRLSSEVEEAGIAVTDLDGDGDLDVVAVATDGQRLVWLENPGTLQPGWKVHPLGERIPLPGAWLDRVVAVDLDGDGRIEIVATEERQDRAISAGLYVYKAVEDRWERRLISRMRSLNSLDVADVDGDGAPDLVVAEHTDIGGPAASDNLTVAFLNRDRGRRWTPELVERGPHSSHLGARVTRLDADGPLSIVSIAWSDYRHVHLWTRHPRSTPAPRRSLRRRRTSTCRRRKGLATWQPI